MPALAYDQLPWTLHGLRSTPHTVWKNDCEEFQTVRLLPSTVVEFLKILVCSEVAQAHWSAYIHKITIDIPMMLGKGDPKLLRSSANS